MRKRNVILIGVLGGILTVIGALLCWSNVLHARKLSRESERIAEANRRMGGAGGVFLRVRSRAGSYNWVALNFRRSSVNDAALEHLTGLPAIFGLDLSDTKVTDAGLVHIRGLKNLEYLQLGGTSVTDHGLQNLMGLDNLEALDLSRTNVTQEGARFLEALPNVKTVYAGGSLLARIKGVTVFHGSPEDSWTMRWNTGLSGDVKTAVSFPDSPLE